ncbi:MAG: TonB-dependent receptor [Gammaproteobacteria bacterium]|nr:TonB-dependent receptor [Gammaproteobacteria bacterium]
MQIQAGAVALLLVTLPISVSAQKEIDRIDEIIVAGYSITAREAEIEVDQKMLVNTAAALKYMPGANVNSNGLITGIAQYRGMYGDRVAVTIDNHAIVSGGPNAMDAPLSYISPMITEALVVERGITSVSSVPESIGGHLKTRLARGSFGSEDFEISGFVGSRYSGNGDISTSAGRLTISNDSHRFSAIAELDLGQNVQSPVGKIRPSAIDRKRYDVSYAFTNGDDHFVVFAGKLNTLDSGTPALPMDIRSIDTDLIGSHFLYAASPSMAIEGRVSSNDVEHVMDNFALRAAPPAMMHRQNHATGSGKTYALAAKYDFETSTLRFGIDGVVADHDSTITNPNNAAFRVANFSGVTRELASIFGEWMLERDATALELGVSFKHVTTDAGEVGATGMMSPAVSMLAGAFNSAKRELTFDDVDAVIKYRYRSRDNLEWRVEAGRKSRAPSYQELYLWLPMQATGGLADGRTYIGDLGLQSEVSNEINLGVFATTGRLSVSPQLFYKRIDNYIQGSPSSNAAANMVATMMAGNTALQFSNTDAEIWGLDIAWTLSISERVTLDGVATYARGRRTDISDDLYRLAPLNGSIGLTYATESWVFDTRVVAYGSQKNVAAFNDEQPSAGYEIVNAGLVWTPNDSLRVEARIDNIFDATYQDHLAGVNRASGSDIPAGIRLFGAERTLLAGVIFSF